MLLRFCVSNFLSFKECAEFSMIAEKENDKHIKHLKVINNISKKKHLRILKGGFLFGANASGKSNFIHAIKFARDIVLRGISSVNLEKKYFRLDKESRNMPGVFQFDIYQNERIYSYGFAIDYQKARFLQEWLYDQTEMEKCIFLRGIDEEEQSYCESELEFKDENEQQKFDVYRKAISQKKMNGILFLHDMYLHGDERDSAYVPFRDVIEWFQRLILIFPDSKYQPIYSYIKEDTQKNLVHYLGEFDTGIKDVQVVKKDIDSFDKFPMKILGEIKQDIIHQVRKGKNSSEIVNGIIQANGELFELESKDDNIFINQLGLNHGNSNDLFGFSDESDGTKRLVNLLPIFKKSNLNKIIIVDEIDRSLHTIATTRLIREFYHWGIDAESQMIDTTQDSNILDLSLLRPDEIWFVERGQKMASSLYPLCLFKLRFDSNLERDYLIGRYGAIPIFTESK